MERPGRAHQITKSVGCSPIRVGSGRRWKLVYDVIHACVLVRVWYTCMLRCVQTACERTYGWWASGTGCFVEFSDLTGSG